MSSWWCFADLELVVELFSLPELDMPLAELTSRLGVAYMRYVRLPTSIS